MSEAMRVSPEHPILVDKFLEDAIEIDVDAIADGERVVVGGVMEHVEKAGIHSGDSACALPPVLAGGRSDRADQDARRGRWRGSSASSGSSTSSSRSRTSRSSSSR